MQVDNAYKRQEKSLLTECINDKYSENRWNERQERYTFGKVFQLAFGENYIYWENMRKFIQVNISFQ